MRNILSLKAMESAGKYEDLLRECSYQATRSQGPGGQNVNKLSTRVELRFDVPGSQYLDEEEKKMILDRLANRINQEGILILASQASRSQFKNREDVNQRLVDLIKSALKKKTKRIPTKPGKKSIEKRLQEKKKQAEKKNLRKLP